MRVAKDDVDVQMEIPGAVIRQRTDFGESAARRDQRRVLHALCRGRHHAAVRGAGGRSVPVPALGLRPQGQLTTTDATGEHETVRANDLFYWPPGHNVRVDADAEIVMFSPQREHTQVIEHMIEKVHG